MNYLVLLMGAFLALGNMDKSPSSNNLTDWKNYKDLHAKSYPSPEIDSLRRLIFFHNKQQVEKFASEPEADMFQLELNHFADQSQAEMAALNGLRVPKNEATGLRELPRNSVEAQRFLDEILNDDSKEVPDSLDWRQVPGRVTSVKNQGSCGSCWAFATTGTLEGQEKVRASNLTDSLIPLSEQNLIDCDKKEYGCNGGFMSDALEFIRQEGGIDDEASYPYKARNGECQFRKDKVAFSDNGSAILPVGDEQKLKEMVAKFGPVAVGIDASSLFFQFYRRGVYVNKHCRNKQDDLDHAVLVVGYGTDEKRGDYWIVKNSWGPKWGEKGYIRMARNRKNMCGIATAATIPTF